VTKTNVRKQPGVGRKGKGKGIIHEDAITGAERAYEFLLGGMIRG